jgi:hypothetical protein
VVAIAAAVGVWTAGTWMVTPVGAAAAATSHPEGARVGGARHLATPRVLYVGDSMAWTSQHDLAALIAPWRLDTATFGGTAPCDWIERVRDAVADARPAIVVVSFLGNNLTPCTAGATGVDLLDAYRRDVGSICLAAWPARCLVVGQPTVPADVGWTMPPSDEPTAMYRAGAARGSWSFIDAGAAVELPDGGFDPSLRDPDRVHFTPEGAHRYASAIADAVRAPRSHKVHKTDRHLSVP